jgi:orotate phosphoribosyltransferase-like protein
VENKKIRLAAKGAGVTLWRIANELSISEPTLTRLLRNPLTAEKEFQVHEIIRRLSAEDRESNQF